jgi:hypothetical protein
MPADIAKYALGIAFVPTGTLTTTAGLLTVVGTGTHFTTEFSIDDVLLIGGLSYSVFSITDNTHMVLNPSQVASASGVAFTGINLHTTIMQRGVAEPKGIFNNYSQPLDLANASLRGGGWPTAEWQWGYLTRPQRDALRLLMAPDGSWPASAQVFIKTLHNEYGDPFVVFQAEMMWPQAEPKEFTRRKPFTVRFRALVQQPRIP